MRRLVVPALLALLLLAVVAACAAASARQSAPAPTIASVTPATAPNTGPVTLGIKGSGFDTRGRLTAKLVKGSTTVTAVAARATRENIAQARFELTGVAAGAYDVVVANPDGQQATLSAAFTVTADVQAKPAITKLRPTSGKRKATVTITGTGFGATRAATSFVKFGAKKCTVYTSWSPTTIKCKVPKKAAFGRVKVVVTTAGGASNAKNFTVKK
jgi:hypothetical protein